MITRVMCQLVQLQVENKINPWTSQAKVLLDHQKIAMQIIITLYVEETTLLDLAILIRVQVSLHQCWMVHQELCQCQETKIHYQRFSRSS